MARRFRKGLLICAIFSGIIIALAVALFVSFAVWTGSAGLALSRVLFSDSEIPVTLTVFGRSTDAASGGASTISARLAFFNPDGDLAGSLERSWPGWELKIDCIMIGTGKGWLAFPWIVTTDATVGRGVDLLHYYNRSDFPAIYDSPRLMPEERSALRRLFWIVRTERWIPEFLGTLHHETVSIRSFDAGTEYSLFVAKDGTLQLRSN